MGLKYTNSVNSCGRTICRNRATSSASGPQKNTAAIPVNPPHHAFIYSNNIPVGRLDDDIVGHLWLMFASQCYWNSLGANKNRLTPVYDWNASVGVSPRLKVAAKWDLMDGSGSLPREVDYLGQWDETNGFYNVTGTNSVGGMFIPSGFIFEERHVGPLVKNGYIHELALRKRVEAKVTSVRPACSLRSLLPVPVGRTIIIDYRLAGGPMYGGKYSDFMITAGQWPSLEEAKKLAEARFYYQQYGQPPPQQPSKVVLAVMCLFLVAPPIAYIAMRLRRPKKS